MNLETFAAAANQALRRCGSQREEQPVSAWYDLWQEGFRPAEAAAFFAACTPSQDMADAGMPSRRTP